jgi:hypothetical protein
VGGSPPSEHTPNTTPDPAPLMHLLMREVHHGHPAEDER